MTSEYNFRPLGLGFGDAACPFIAMALGAGAHVAKQLGAQATELRPVFKKMKAVQDMVRYTKEELVQYAKRWTRCPPELEFSKLSLVVPEAARDRNRAEVLKLIGGGEEDTWRQTQAEPRTGTPGKGGWDRPPAEDSARGETPSRGKGGESEEFARIQTAADVGQKAWRPMGAGQTASDHERAVKQIRGILNRLAPEKFERLFQQLLEVVSSAETLRKTITLVFEKAVSEPTFTFLYADLCLRLSKELPEFPPPAGETKPIAFRKVLLNTCHDEFEAAREARLSLKKRTEAGLSGEEAEEAERKVKMRTMGTVRLIANLYLKGEVPQWVMSELVQDLLHPPKGQTTDEDDVEALCEMFTVAGKALDERAQEDKGKDGKTSEKAKIEKHFKRLHDLSQDKNLSSRVRFLVREVLDLRANKWVPRRETTRAKKIDEIHAEAEQALGVTIPKDTFTMGARGGAKDVELFPALRSDVGGNGAGARYTHKTGQGDVSSGLLGTFVPRGAEQEGAGAGPNPNLTEEELDRKVQSLIDEYVQVGDEKEAVTCVAEINVTHLPAMSKLFTAITMTMIDRVSERDQGMVLKLAGVLTRKGFITSEHVNEALAPLMSEFGDLALDYPHAPKLFGTLIGALISDGVYPLTSFPALLLPVEDARVRRDLALYALNFMRSRTEDAKIGAMFREHGIAGAAFLSHDPQFDGDMPEVSDWLKENDLAFIPA